MPPPHRALTNAAAIAAITAAMNSPHPLPEEIFRRLLDESSAVLGAPHDAGVTFPDDDLHREIFLPLLPALLGDEAIRSHWHAQAATGFVARITRHLQDGDAAPRWQAGDFEIHVTASYIAGPDAKALADTLLSEDSLRDMAAALMNQILDAVWSKLATPAAEAEAGTAEIAPIAVVEIEEEAVVMPAVEAAVEIAPVPKLPVAEPQLEIAAAWKSAPHFAWLPLHAAMLAQRLKWKAIRGSRENPISGSRTSHGGLGARDWRAGYPLAGWTAQP